MYDGRIVDTVSPDIAREDIGLLMAGATPDATKEVTRMSRRHPPRRPAPQPETRRAGAQGRPAPAELAGCPRVKVTAGAFLIALVIGAFVIAFSDDDVIESLGYFGSYPWDFFTRSADAIWSSYSALVKGSVGSSNAIASTLNRSAPLICAGLGVTLAFRAGLFNIGAQGQLIIGAICAGYVGFTWNLPAGLHLLVALVAGLVGGAVWGGITGFLKARTGAHEVITTIMFNYLAASILIYALSHDAFQRPGSDNALSPRVDDSATFPSPFGDSFNVHLGVILAILAGVRRLVAARAQHLGLRAARGRRQRARVAHRRHERGEGLHARDAVRRGARRACRDHAGAGQPELAQPDAARLDRLRRDHRGPARSGQPARHRARRACSSAP